MLVCCLAYTLKMGRHVFQKRRLTLNRLDDLISHNTELSLTISVRISNSSRILLDHVRDQWRLIVMFSSY
jgi:hypothetical protein